jgi:hypothetical protein
MSGEVIVLFIMGGVVISIVVFLLIRLLPKRVKKSSFVRKWRELQTLCGDKITWPDALEQADILLEEALKKRKYAGATIGERLVAAQKAFSSNDAVWSAHKYVVKVKENREMNLKESDIKDALVAFRQALRDLGVL